VKFAILAFRSTSEISNCAYVFNRVGSLKLTASTRW
jgi:hypothetical protein